MKSSDDGLYLVLISIHGLVRGHNMELGRDADTGGQIRYVIELTRALAAQPEVERVDLLTRCVADPRVDPDYSQPEEMLAPGARIIRLHCGPRRYLRKESLWPHLDAFVDNALQHVRRVGRTPDAVHSHYADAGYVGAKMAQLLGVPLIHTGHSLGRVKRQRLLASGVSEQSIEKQYSIAQRIEAEEVALGNEALVIASTRQEVDQQYSLYENYHPQRMVVIPPGVDLDRFHPPGRTWRQPPIAEQVERFLHRPRKPMILAISRPDPRKNISTLVEAYAENPDLRELANLVVVAGERDDIRAMDKGPREVLTELLYLIDRYDLYGRIAIPKHQQPNDVPDLYRMAARSRGVFVNPALTEPFGLTLIEAAASGLPVVATRDGGPIDIVANCKNGLLVDPLDADVMGETLHAALADRSRWLRWSKNGVRGALQHYSWEGHVRKYLREVRRVIGKRRKRRTLRVEKSRLPVVDRLLICDIDNTLLGDAQALQTLLSHLEAVKDHVAFGVATGRRLESTLKVLKQWDVPVPDILITAVGSEIHYGNTMAEDLSWARQIDYRWNPEALREALTGVAGLRLQPASEQRRFKLSYYVDPDKAPPLRDIRRRLRERDLHTRLIYSHDTFLDFLPERASKGLAVRYLGMRWDIDPDHMLVAGDSGNDEEMLRGNTLGVVVGNYSPELEKLREQPRIFFAAGEHAWGILDGIEYYDFFGRLGRVAEE